MRCLLGDNQCDVQVLDADGHAMPACFEFDAIDAEPAAAWCTEPVPCEPGRRYCVSAHARRTAGEGRFVLSLQWLGADGESTGQKRAWSSELAGHDWIRVDAEGMAPAGASCVRAGIEAGPGCCFALRGLQLEMLPDAPPGEDIAAAPPPSSHTAHAIEFPARAAELPEPSLPAMQLRLGAHYHSAMPDWERGGKGIRHSAGARPALGCYDEWLPDVADWHIYWALEHGISWFAFEWHYNQGYFCCNDALDRGLLASRFATRMQFCINWRNDGRCTDFRPPDFSHRSLDGFIRTLCVRCFHLPNYLRVGDRLVVIVGSAARLANAHGGWDGCAHALDRMRTTAAEYGHTGIYFVAQHDGGACLPEYGRGGFDAVATGSCGLRGVPADAGPPSTPYGELLPRQREYHAEAHRRACAQGLHYIPAAWAGTTGASPALFRKAVELLPEFADSAPRLALVDSWNKWGEGSAVEPGEPHGFARLVAIRDALSECHDDYRIAAPTPAEAARVNTDIAAEMLADLYLGRYSQAVGLADGFRMTFNSPHALWLRPVQQTRNVRIEEGILAGDSTGNSPLLAGPPMMGLPSERIPGVALRMRVCSGRAARIYWTTDAAATRSEELSVVFGVNPDGFFHDYVVRLAANQGWSGGIRQLFLSPADTPGHFEIRELRTIAIEGEDEE